MTPSLFPYQIEGVAFLSSRNRALLADTMGLGKTRQAIVAMDRRVAIDVERLVVCPASAVSVWKREITSVSTSTAWRIVSYAKVGALDIKPRAVILDEVHFLKTRDSKRTQAVFGEKCDGVGGLIEKAEVVYAITGTPTPNNPSEIWTIARALFPKSIQRRGEPMNFWQFVARFCETRNNDFGIQITGGKNLESLRKSLSPFVLRRKKEQVLKDLPPIRFETLPLDAKAPHDDPEIAAAFKRGGLDALRALEPHTATWRKNTGKCKVAAAVEWIKDFLEGGGKKLVVFSVHLDVMAALKAAFKPGTYASIDGATSAAARSKAVESFQEDPGCVLFFGQIVAAGTAITLTAASDLLFIESSWTPSDNEQAAMRIHRIGQKNGCIVRTCYVQGSIDENIAEACTNKMQSITALWG